MINYYRGLRRIWIVLWILTSSAVIFFICSILEPNPATPLANIHPTGALEPQIAKVGESSDVTVDSLSKWEKIAKTLDNKTEAGKDEFQLNYDRLKTAEHAKQVEAHSKWESELIPAFRLNAYWKNVGLLFLALSAWSALVWGGWAAGVWIIRGFTSKT
jgi:hypothetical protein